MLVCFGLWSLETLSALDPYKDANGTCYTENGTESFHLPCGEVPDNVHGIEWQMYKFNKWRRILKFTNGEQPKNFPNYTEDKYGVSDSDKTTLVVRHIDISESGLFRCRTVGTDIDYSYTTLLQVVGKSQSVWLFNTAHNDCFIIYAKKHEYTFKISDST